MVNTTTIISLIAIGGASSILTDLFVIITSTFVLKVRDPIPKLMRLYSVCHYLYFVFIVIGNLSGNYN